MAGDPALDHIGVRELRATVADIVRRAGSGERIVVTVDGRAVARIGPLGPDDGGVGVDDLYAAGLLRPPDRFDRPEPPDPIDLPVDASVESTLRDLRGS